MMNPVDFSRKVVDYDYFLSVDVCRVCWNKDARHPIFKDYKTQNKGNNSSTAVKEEELSKKIMNCANIQLEINDPYPNRLCESCLLSLDIAYHFKSTCEESDKRLKEIMCNNQMEIKDEISEDYASTHDPIATRSKSKAKLRVGVKEERLYKGDAESGDMDNDGPADESCDAHTPSESNAALKKEEPLDSLEDEADHLKILRIQAKAKLKNQNSISHYALMDDKLVESRSNVYYCPVCRIKFENANDLNKHIMDVHENVIYHCFGCEKKYTSRSIRDKHEARCKGLTYGYSCGDCTLVAPTRLEFEAHTRDVGCPGSRCKNVIQCVPCNKVFKTKANLAAHMTIHQSKKNYICEICGRSFNRRDYLRVHLPTHTGAKRYACPHCDFRSAQKSSLTVHLRRHTGERPYTCDVCGQKCVNSSNLLAHRRRHDGIKRFKCELCGKLFGYKLSLEEHMIATHGEMKNYVCPVCAAPYSRKRGLRRHVAQKHPGQQVRSVPDAAVRVNGSAGVLQLGGGIGAPGLQLTVHEQPQIVSKFGHFVQ